MEGGWFSLGLSFFPLLHLHRGGGGGVGNWKRSFWFVACWFACSKSIYE